MVCLLDPVKSHNVVKSLLTNLGLLSFKTYFWILYESNQLSRIILAKCINVTFPEGIGQVSLELQLVIINRCWLPDDNLSNGPNISVSTDSSRPGAGTVESHGHDSFEILLGGLSGDISLSCGGRFLYAGSRNNFSWCPRCIVFLRF